MKQNNKRKLIGIASAVVLLLTVGTIGVTLAMIQTQTATAQNNFAGAAVNVGVVENGTTYENGNNTVIYDKITSGGIDKNVAIQNITSDAFPTTDTYVRVRLVPIFRDGTGAAVPMAAGVLADNVKYTFAANSKWKVETKDNGEKYYYYSEALAPGVTSEALIEKVAFDGTVPTGTTFELQVLVEGIAANQPGALSEAWGVNDLSALPTVSN